MQKLPFHANTNVNLVTDYRNKTKV